MCSQKFLCLFHKIWDIINLFWKKFFFPAPHFTKTFDGIAFIGSIKAIPIFLPATSGFELSRLPRWERCVTIGAVFSNGGCSVRLCRVLRRALRRSVRLYSTVQAQKQGARLPAMHRRHSYFSTTNVAIVHQLRRSSLAGTVLASELYFSSAICLSSYIHSMHGGTSGGITWNTWYNPTLV